MRSTRSAVPGAGSSGSIVVIRWNTASPSGSSAGRDGPNTRSAGSEPRTPHGYKIMPGRSPTWSACIWLRSTASRRVKSSPASANADGEPRPQSTKNTRPSTTTADEIPPRPATGIGAPAVPSKTSSVPTPPPGTTKAQEQRKATQYEGYAATKATQQRKPSVLQPDFVERHRHDAVRQLTGSSAPRPVPLHHRVDHSVEQPGDSRRADVGTQGALVPGLRDQPGHGGIELPPPRQRPPLRLGVPPDPQQQGDEGQLRHQQQHAAPGQFLQSRDGRRLHGRDLVQHREQPVERPVHGQPEQLLLARHVVVDRGLGDAQLPGQVLHAGPVVAALVEHLDRAAQHRLQVVAGPAAPHAHLHPATPHRTRPPETKTDRMFSREL